MIHICENCASELKFEKKKLGRGSKYWYVCPKCLLRVKVKSRYFFDRNKLNDIENFVKEKFRINSNGDGEI